MNVFLYYSALHNVREQLFSLFLFPSFLNGQVFPLISRKTSDLSLWLQILSVPQRVTLAEISNTWDRLWTGPTGKYHPHRVQSVWPQESPVETSIFTPPLPRDSEVSPALPWAGSLPTVWVSVSGPLGSSPSPATCRLWDHRQLITHWFQPCCPLAKRGVACKALQVIPKCRQHGAPLVCLSKLFVSYIP